MSIFVLCQRDCALAELFFRNLFGNKITMFALVSRLACLCFLVAVGCCIGCSTEEAYKPEPIPSVPPTTRGTDGGGGVSKQKMEGSTLADPDKK